MKAPQGKGLKAELNVTPLVDVVLVLLIIFMVVTPFMKNTAVELPRAHTSENKQTNPAPIVLTVTSERRLMLGSSEVPREHLSRVLRNVLASNPDVEIYVQGDRRLRFKDVKDVLDAAHEAGAKRLALAAAEQKE